MAISILIALMYTEVPSYTLLPGTTDGMELFFILIFLLVPPIIFSLLFGYVFSPLFLFLHKIILGRKMQYGIQKREESNQFKKSFRGLFPGLMAMNLSLFLVPFLKDIIIRDTILSVRSEGNITFLSFIFILLITIGPSTGIFAATWFLNDAGICYTNIEKVKKENTLIEVRGVGKWYMYALKGYAGVGVIISFISILLDFLNRTDELFVIVSDAIFSVLTPFILMVAIMPSLLILDYLKDHRVEYIRRWGEKLGIKKVLNVEISI
jgi:hypothetical protein